MVSTQVPGTVSLHALHTEKQMFPCAATVCWMPTCAKTPATNSTTAKDLEDNLSIIIVNQQTSNKQTNKQKAGGKVIAITPCVVVSCCQD